MEADAVCFKIATENRSGRIEEIEKGGFTSNAGSLRFPGAVIHFATSTI